MLEIASFQPICLSHKNFQFGKNVYEKFRKWVVFHLIFLSHRNFRFGNKLGKGG